MAEPSHLDITFTAQLGKVRPGDTWTCVQLPIPRRFSAPVAS